MLKKLCALALALMLLIGCAAAEEYEAELSGEVQSAQMQLFTSGAIPQPRRMRAVTPPGFADYVAEQMRSQPEKINVLSYAIRPEDLPVLLSDVINNNPDLFYIGSNIEYTTGSKTGNVYNIFPEYLYTGDDLKNRIASFNATVSQITAHAKSVSSDPVGRMIAVNDYFCTHYQYDNSLSIYGPDQLFTGGTGVCQAYMLAYAAVLDQLGIENTHATSYSMNHTWNLVQLDGDWYHVDVTWNDPDRSDLVTSYRYFLLSDTGMENNKHYGWTASYSADNEILDNLFWRRIYTPLSQSVLKDLTFSQLKQKLTLPAAVGSVAEEAFFGTDAWQVQLPSALKSIGERAFAGSSQLHVVEVPSSVSSISASAFENSPNVVLVVAQNSYAQRYAAEKNIPCLIAY